MTPLARDEATVREGLPPSGMTTMPVHPTKAADANRYHAALARIVGQARAAEELQRELDEAKSISFARETKAAVWKGRAERYEKALRRAKMRAMDAHNECGIAAPQDHFLDDVVRIVDAALAGAGVTDNERPLTAGGVADKGVDACVPSEVAPAAATPTSDGARFGSRSLDVPPAVSERPFGPDAGISFPDDGGEPAGERPVGTGPLTAGGSEREATSPIPSVATPPPAVSGTGPTAAEHAEVVTKAMWAKQPPGAGSLERDHDDYDWTMQQGKESLAALVALADRTEQATTILSEPTVSSFLVSADSLKNDNEALDFALYTLERLDAVLAGGAGDE